VKRRAPFSILIFLGLRIPWDVVAFAFGWSMHHGSCPARVPHSTAVYHAGIASIAGAGRDGRI
jgi:hypothetical protein